MESNELFGTFQAEYPYRTASGLSISVEYWHDYIEITKPEKRP